MKNELQVKVNQKLGIIDFNYEEMKQKLSKKVEQYNNIVVTADTRTIAKKDVASLRKLKKELDDRRIKVKKEYDKPYDEFKKRVDELTGLIDRPIELIDKQVKAFEDKEKKEKKKEIEELYSELIGDNKEYLPLSKIYNKRWENVSFKIKEVEKEISESVAGVDLAVATIKGMNSEVEDKALELFKDDLSLANAITYINKHEQLKAEILAKEQAKRKEEEERKRRQEEEKIREQERQRVIEEERIRREVREKAIEEERQRVAKEESLKKALKEEKQEELEKIREEDVEIIDSEKVVSFSISDEEPFLDVIVEPSLFDAEKPFDVSEEQAFVKKSIIIDGTDEELKQIEMLLIRNKVMYRLEEI